MTDSVTLALRLALLAILYLFLAVVARIAWRDFGSAAPRRRGSVGQATLLVLEGGAGGPRSGDRIVLDGGASIGRDSDNGIVIDDRTVSGRHASLLYDAGRWWVEDGGSTNGTYINGQRVERTAALGDGDVLQVGRVTFRLSA